MTVRLPDAPPEYEPGWANSLVSALNIALGNLSGPQPLVGYTKAKLPKAERYARCLVYVIDGDSNKRVAVSDGTVWRYMDGVLVT